MMTDTSVPLTVNDLPSPSFLIDLEKVKRNANKMIDICQKLGVRLRPHMKTQKTVELGVMMTNGTKQRIEVSTLDEAEFYAKNGFDDILYAHPLINCRIERCKKLAYSLKLFHVMIENAHGLESLLENPLENEKKWSVYLEIDDGHGRTGVPYNSNEVVNLASRAASSPYIDFQGLYLFNGRTYLANSQEEIENMGRDGKNLLLSLSERLSEKNIECKVLSIGNTPCCSHPDNSMNVLTEFHPGNYIFYDIQQSTIGSCTKEEIACRIMTRVIGHKPANNTMFIDCGFLALSYDGMNLHPNEFATFENNPDLTIKAMSQEIGKVTSKSGKRLDYERHPIGSHLFIFPWHSCATACQHTVYYVHSGEKIVDTWRPTKGW